MIDSSLKQDHDYFKPANIKGQIVPSKDPIGPVLTQSACPQNKMTWLADKIRQHKIIAALILGFFILAAILTPLIHMGLEQQTITALLTSSDWNVPLKSGISMKSSLVELQKKSKKITLTVNSLAAPSATRLLQDVTPTPKFFSYYHKDSEISVSFSEKWAAQIRVPQKGIDFVVPQVPQQSEEAFYKMPLELPLALIKALSQVSGKKVAISTDISYDGVYNKTTNEYTLLTHKQPYHPEQFGKIEPDELNLLKIKPAITNLSDIIQVTSKIATVVANIVNNTKLIIFENKERLMKLVESSINKAANDKGISTQADKALKCVRLGEEVMRCPESVWRSGELKVKNINDPDPVQILEIVIDIQ